MNRRSYWLQVSAIIGGFVFMLGLLAFAAVTEVLKFMALWKWVFS